MEWIDLSNCPTTDGKPFREFSNYPRLPPGLYWRLRNHRPPDVDVVIIYDDGKTLGEIGTDEAQALLREFWEGSKLYPLPIPDELRA